MELNKLKISRHFLNDHMERYVYIQMATGIGNPVLKLWDSQRKLNNYITDTGVFLVVNPEDTLLITAFYGTIDKVYVLCLQNEVEFPEALKNILYQNKKVGLLKRQTEIDKQERIAKRK